MSLQKNSLENCRILIVDDNESIASLLSEVLVRFGAKPVKVLSGQAAVDAIQARKFDLVLLDILMEDMDGWDVLAEIDKNQPELRSKTIIMTGDGFRFETAQQIREFDLPVLYKPFNIQTLRELACQILRGAQAVKLTAA